MTRDGFSATEAFFKISGETKALILVNEFRSGSLVLPELRMLLSVLARSDLEKVGVLELIRRNASTYGLSGEEAEALLAGLQGGQAVEKPRSPMPQSAPPAPLGSAPMPPPPAPSHPASPGKTVRVQRFDAPTPTQMIRRSADPTAPAATPQRTPGLREATKTVSLGPQAPMRKASHGETTALHRQGTPQWNPDSAEPVKNGSPAARKRKRILVADDDGRIRRLFCEKLIDNGLAVEEAENGDVAWQKLQESQFDVMVMDMKMPGLHGLELLSRLTEAGAKQAVVVCSAYDQLRDEFVVATYKKLRYLVKPVPFEKLLAAVKDLLQAQESADADS